MFIEKTPTENSQKLKIKRESLGLSLDDVFKKIRIRSSYLQDIENGQFHLLPDPVYTRNFIKTYAKFLNLDEEPILQDYDAFINARKEEQMPQPEATPEERPIFASVANKKNYFGLILALVIVFIIWLIVQQNSPVSMEIDSHSKINTPTAQVREQNVNLSPNATSAGNQQMAANAVTNVNAAVEGTPGNVLKQPLTQEASVNKPSGETKQITPTGGQKSNLLIVASEETWLRIKPGENPPFQILLQPGEKVERSEETFNLDIGNAGGIKIQYKGKYIENVGKSGEVIHIQLPQLTNKN